MWYVQYRQKTYCSVQRAQDSFVPPVTFILSDSMQKCTRMPAYMGVETDDGIDVRPWYEPGSLDRLFAWHAAQGLDASGQRPVFTKPSTPPPKTKARGASSSG